MSRARRYTVAGAIGLTVGTAMMILAATEVLSIKWAAIGDIAFGAILTIIVAFGVDGDCRRALFAVTVAAVRVAWRRFLYSQRSRRIPLRDVVSAASVKAGTALRHRATSARRRSVYQGTGRPHGRRPAANGCGKHR